MFVVQLVEQAGRLYRGIEADSVEEAKKLLEQEEYDEYDPIEVVGEEFRIYKDQETFENDPGDYKEV